MYAILSAMNRVEYFDGSMSRWGLDCGRGRERERERGLAGGLGGRLGLQTLAVVALSSASCSGAGDGGSEVRAGAGVCLDDAEVCPSSGSVPLALSMSTGKTFALHTHSQSTHKI